MLINAPVYTLQNNTHFVNIYIESEDGTFKRTQSEPLRLLRDDFAGISMSQGELVSHHFDRQERSWSTATVTYHYGRPQSFYQFLRDMVARNKFFVFSKPVLAGHLIKFDVHELKLKNSISQRKISILKEKYIEALDLWTREEYELRKQHEQAKTQKIKTQKAKLVQGLPPRTASGDATGHHAREKGAQVVAFKSKDVDNKRIQTSSSSSLSLEPDNLRAQHFMMEKEGLKNKSESEGLDENNPFVNKSIFRHTHFLRRFIFNRS